MNLRLKHFCFLVAGTSHGRQCDLKNYFPSFVVTRHEQIHKNVYCGREEGDRNCVLPWGKKKSQLQ